MTDAHDRGGEGGMSRLTVRLPDEQHDGLEALVDDGSYPTKSEAARDAIRRLLRERPPKQRDDSRKFLRTDGGVQFDFDHTAIDCDKEDEL